MPLGSPRPGLWGDQAQGLGPWTCLSEPDFRANLPWRVALTEPSGCIVIGTPRSQTLVALPSETQKGGYGQHANGPVIRCERRKKPRGDEGGEHENGKDSRTQHREQFEHLQSPRHRQTCPAVTVDTFSKAQEIEADGSRHKERKPENHCHRGDGYRQGWYRAQCFAERKRRKARPRMPLPITEFSLKAHFMALRSAWREADRRAAAGDGPALMK